MAVLLVAETTTGTRMVGVAAAASTAIAGLLQGPPRAGVVVAATRHLVAVQVDDGASPALVCVAGPGAARLPCSMVVTAPVSGLPVGARAMIGRSELRLPGLRVVPTRWWPAQPTIVSDASRCATRAAACARPELGATLTEATDHLAVALHSRHIDLDHAVHGLLGLGPGLTPAGDDVLAGALVALRATNRPAAGQLAAAVGRAGPFTRTTAVSAGLLGYAARGLSVPQLAALLTALDSPVGDVHAAHRALLGVGHTSGAALYLGVLAALAPLSVGSVP